MQKLDYANDVTLASRERSTHTVHFEVRTTVELDLQIMLLLGDAKLHVSLRDKSYISISAIVRNSTTSLIIKSFERCYTGTPIR